MDGCYEYTGEDNKFREKREQVYDDVLHVHVLLSWQGRSAHVGIIRSSGIQKPTAKREAGSGLFLFWGLALPQHKKHQNQGGKENVEERI